MSVKELSANFPLYCSSTIKLPFDDTSPVVAPSDDTSPAVIPCEIAAIGGADFVVIVGKASLVMLEAVLRNAIS